MKDGGKFLLTLAAADFYELGGKDLSVVIRANFLPTAPDTIYPNIGIQCFLHESSRESSCTATAMESIVRGSLSPVPGDGLYFIKYGGSPELLQKELYYEEA